MQPTSEKCSYLEELSCKEYSLKENQSCFNQNQDNLSRNSALDFTLELKLKITFLLPDIALKCLLQRKVRRLHSSVH